MKIITKANISSPEIKSIQTKNGNPMVKFSVADNRYMGKNPDGSAITKPVFVECVAFNNNAVYLLKHAQKGSAVFFEAELDYDVLTYENGTRVPKVSFIIQTVQVVSNGKTQSNKPVSNTKPIDDVAKQAQNNVPFIEINEDETPF